MSVGEVFARSAGQSWRGALAARIADWLNDRGHDSQAQRTAGGAFLIRMAGAAFAYLLQVALARWMGTSEFGVYVYVWTWALLIGGIADAGLAIAAQRFVPEYAERALPALLRGFLVGSRAIAFALAFALALIGALAVRFAEPWLDQATIIPLYLACLCLPAYALAAVQDGVARCFNWIYLGLAPAYIIRPLLLIALMLAAYRLGFASDAATAIGAAVLSFWLVAAVQAVLLSRRLAGTVAPGARAYDARLWLTAAVPVVAVSGFYMLLSYVDILVLQHLRSSQEVALYHAAAKTLTLVTFVYFAVAAATAHRFSAYHAAGERARLEEFIARAVRWTFWPSLGISAVVLALGKPFLWLFGPDFVAAYPLMFVLAGGLLARAALGPAERLLTMLNEQRACALVYASAFAFNLGACVALVPRYGGMGAAIATSLALMLESVLLFQVAKRRLGLNVFVFSRSDLAGQPMRALRQIALAFGGRATPSPALAPQTADHLAGGGHRQPGTTYRSRPPIAG